MAAAAVPPEELVERFQRLQADLGQIEDPGARRSCEELIAVVVDLYGEGLRRVFEAIDAEGDATGELRAGLADDGLVASLMLIHDLYPVPLADRVAEALDSVRPYMESHGGDVELIGLDEGVARIRLSGSCDGCPASASTLELAIKQALDEHAPDLVALEVEGGVAAAGIEAEADGMALPIVQAPIANRNGAAAAVNGNGAGTVGLPSWFGVDGVEGLADGELTATAAAGTPLIVANVDGSLLAYRDACADCGGRLEHGVLDDGVLGCPGCSRRYYLPRAGRSLDDERLQLEPVPLLREDGAVRVALAT